MLRRSLVLNQILQLILVIIIVVLANRWSIQNFFRLDLTAEKIYALDLSTKQLTWNLERPLYAKVFFTEDLEAPYNNHKEILIDKLEELKAYSKGRMRIEVIDPTTDVSLQEEAQRFGIQAIPYQFRDKNRIEQKKVYMGLALIYGDRQESLIALTRTEMMEYELHLALRRIISADSEKKIIGIASGHSEANFIGGGGPLQALRTALKKHYEIVPVTLGSSQEIPDSVKMLWVIGPQKSYSKRAQYQLDQFLMKGGSVGLFLTNTKPNLKFLSVESVYHGLELFLSHYGVQLKRDVVIDRSANGQIPYPSRVGSEVRFTQTNHPLVPKTTEVNSTSNVVNKLESFLAPFVSSIDLNMPLPPSIQGEVWVRSSSESGRLQGLRHLALKAFAMRDPGEKQGSWPLVVALQGNWTSFFADEEIPLSPDGKQIDTDKIVQGSAARLVVAGSADIVANNPDFIINLADWMAGEEDLIPLRGKMAQIKSFDVEAEENVAFWKWINLFSGIGLIVLLAFLRYFLRYFTRNKGVS